MHVFGCPNTGDIFIRYKIRSESEFRSVFIELKFSKRRGNGADLLPGDLQRSIGQSVIASMQHDLEPSKFPFQVFTVYDRQDFYPLPGQAVYDAKIV